MKLRQMKGKESMKKPKAVIFDFGGTIVKLDEVDYFNGIRAIVEIFDLQIDSLQFLHESFIRFDKEIFDIDKRNIFQISFYSYIKLFFDKMGIFLPDNIYKIEEVFHRGVYGPYEYENEIIEFINELKKNKISTGIVSNHMFSSLSIYNEIKDNVYVDFIISSSDYGIGKPHLFLFEVALSNLRCEATEVWFIGDNLINDISGAQNARMKGVWYNNKKKLNKTNIVPFMEVSEYKKLIEILKKM